MIFKSLRGTEGQKFPGFWTSWQSDAGSPLTVFIMMSGIKGKMAFPRFRAKAHLKDYFLLMMGDCLVDPALLKSLLQNPLSDGNIILAVDRNVDNTLIDVNDATKVLVHDGKVEGIGKDLKKFKIKTLPQLLNVSKKFIRWNQSCQYTSICI
ncbi:MAG: hypothetical protein JRJ77_12485 [Deltaproteobacteria bacterium]|nr:hypothetical protein [Deltaproteobacteria bacterium]MBW2341639.1 hypothetical protein [Deltaproteobacteria bacterium]